MEGRNKNRLFENLGGYNKLNKKIKAFSITAQAWHIKYIKEKLNSKKPLVSYPILITIDEEQMQTEECSMKKEELIIVIKSLIGSLNETNRPQFKGLKTKKKEELLVILQQVQDLINDNEID
ncbi:7792_t:CDS:2 [Dentiscutata erythropus]|uniref:7792_t:CDS:1 n=1 Tax=Dentiscutata erythropus TaxID=1348616 RepID=A0A9N9EMT4_9GLOM|nr:7792_t:CDS:2 [Dentiscutata erythropus]